MKRARVVSALGAALVLATLARAAQEARARVGEGALDNNAFLATSDTATQALATADRRALELAGKPLDETTRRAWLEVVDALHVALRDSRTGEMVAPLPQSGGGIARPAWPDVDGTADAKLDRRRDGVEVSVLRRLSLLPAAVRGLWRERFGDAAHAALAAAGTAVEALAQVERNFPGTRSAAHAALALCDHAFERGSPGAARQWLARAEVHLRLAEEASSQVALTARRERLERDSALAQRSAEVWSQASSLVAVGSVPLDSPPYARVRSQPEPGLGFRPGLCFLDARRALLHTPGNGSDARPESIDQFVLVDLASARRTALLGPTQLLDALGVFVGPGAAPIDAPGWALAPASDGRGVVTTLGRRGLEHGNALVCIDLDPGATDEQVAARLRWAWYDGQPLSGPASASTAAGPDWGATEFQPGVCIVESTLYVTVREFLESSVSDEERGVGVDSSTECQTWIAALDLESGALLWRTKLGKGFEVQRSRGRFLGLRTPTASAQALAADAGHVFVGSNTGFGALVDGLDGRVDWALRNRRRGNERRTWTGARPPLDVAALALLWAPADSDRLYWLRPSADLDGRGLMLAAPRALDDSAILLGGSSDSAMVLARAGAGSALSVWEAHSGRTYFAPELGPSEQFGGEGLASATRAYFASTRGLYLVDRTRECFLLDYARLDVPAGVPTVRGGSLFARDAWVCAVSATTLWVFRAQP